MLKRVITTKSLSTASSIRYISDKTPVIVSFARTPIGSFGGALASIPATRLGAVAVSAAVKKSGISGDKVNEVYLGNVLSAGLGQAPARQAAIFGGLPESVCCTTINKVCASGMKTIMFGAQSISIGYNDVVVAGGFESMSNAPYLLPGGRNGMRYGHGKVLDVVLHDGLWDVYNDIHMGNAAEVCAKQYGFSREDQDKYAAASYTRAIEAWKAGKFKGEVTPVSVPQKKGESLDISEDEEHLKAKIDKFSTLKPAFDKNGTVTAANASSLNDGASALVLVSYGKAKELGLKPLAKILGYADAEKAPVEFTTAPAAATPKALARAGVSAADIDLWEINEAFSVVVLANMKLLDIPHDKVNIWGGAVALGHPIGSSGARIVGTLLNQLITENKAIGCASICNGGGGASAIVIERL